MATHVALETFATSSAISICRPSGHSNVGHHDINAVPFGVSVSAYVILHCDTFCPWLEDRRAGRLRSDATAAV
jgi:hypothetical protein